MTVQGPPEFALQPALPRPWSLLGRASAEGAWTGAVAGVLTAWTLFGLMPDDGSNRVGILIVSTPWAAGLGAMTGAAVALVLTTALLALPARPRGSVAASWATAPLLAVLVGALSVGYSWWNSFSDGSSDLADWAGMLVLTGWAVLAVLWRGRIILSLLRRPAPGRWSSHGAV